MTKARGAKTNDELVKELRKVDDLEKACQSLDKDMEIHHISSTIDGFKEEKQAAKTLDEVMGIIAKEQEFLGGLHNNINYPEEHQHIIEKSKLADSFEGNKDLTNLQEIVNRSLESGAKTENELVADLRAIDDLKEIHVQLDKEIEAHQIKSSFDKIIEEKDKAESAKEVINAIKKEQKFLANLGDNIKYPEEHKELLIKSEIAKKHQEERIVDKLALTTEEIVSSEIKNEEELLKELKNASDIQTTHRKFNKDIEEYHINSTVAEFKKAKQAAKTVRETLNVVHRQQQFLSNLHGNLSHQDHNAELLYTISEAHQSESNNHIEDLHEIVKYTDKSSILTEQQLATHLKSDHSINELHRGLSKICRDHHINTINRHLSELHNDVIVHHDNHKFECPIKYLEHWKNNVDHHLLPIKQIDHAIEQEHERQHELEHTHTIDMGM